MNDINKCLKPINEDESAPKKNLRRRNYECLQALKFTAEAWTEDIQKITISSIGPSESDRVIVNGRGFLATMDLQFI